MLKNLQAEMKRNGISNSDLQALLSCSPKTVTNKLNESTPISIVDAIKIRDTFFPNLGLEYLFSKESSNYHRPGEEARAEAAPDPGPQAGSCMQDSA